jgi:hypothetical protein
MPGKSKTGRGLGVHGRATLRRSSRVLPLLLDVFFFIYYDAVTNHDTRLYTTIEEEPDSTEGSSNENLAMPGCIA